MMNYQDYETVASAINSAVGDVNNFESAEQLNHAAWNILKMVDCQDSITFDTVINGIRNAFFSGYDEYAFEDNMFIDDWDD